MVLEDRGVTFSMHPATCQCTKQEYAGIVKDTRDRVFGVRPDISTFALGKPATEKNVHPKGEYDFRAREVQLRKPGKYTHFGFLNHF